PSPRRGHDPRSGRSGGPGRASLRSAGHGAVRPRRDGPRLPRAVQRSRRHRRPGGGAAQGPRAVRIAEGAMSDLRELYQEVVLDHGRNPRNFRSMDSPDRQSVGFNPLCGDKLTVYVRYRDEVVEDVSFQGSGCAISTASASLLTEAVRGKTK